MSAPPVGGRAGSSTPMGLVEMFPPQRTCTAMFRIKAVVNPSGNLIHSVLDVVRTRSLTPLCIANVLIWQSVAEEPIRYIAVIRLKSDFFRQLSKAASVVN